MLTITISKIKCKVNGTKYVGLSANGSTLSQEREADAYYAAYGINYETVCEQKAMEHFNAHAGPARVIVYEVEEARDGTIKNSSERVILCK